MENKIDNGIEFKKLAENPWSFTKEYLAKCLRDQVITTKEIAERSGVPWATVRSYFPVYGISPQCDMPKSENLQRLSALVVEMLEKR